MVLFERIVCFVVMEYNNEFLSTGFHLKILICVSVLPKHLFDTSVSICNIAFATGSQPSGKRPDAKPIKMISMASDKQRITKGQTNSLHIMKMVARDSVQRENTTQCLFEETIYD